MLSQAGLRIENCKLGLLLIRLDVSIPPAVGCMASQTLCSQLECPRGHVQSLRSSYTFEKGMGWWELAGPWNLEGSLFLRTVRLLILMAFACWTSAWGLPLRGCQNAAPDTLF